MAYDTDLEARIDQLSLNWPGLGKKAMFGGKAYLLREHMAFGIWRDRLIARCGPERYAACLAEPHVEAFAATGKPMTGWVMIPPDALSDSDELLRWLEIGRDYAACLPAK
jgi:TfoX/Sxy family transcriptional regulator of competence genes